ncbi:MAG TPA: VWA domain-containing protein [Terriglobales bacterium]|nr:VWA domain-containing protein [Terriglobales bacterium]
MSAAAQSIDDVHVTPPTKSETSTPPGDGLGVHMKPLRVDIDLVRVPVVVTDVHGSPVMDLKRSDFKLFEGEQEQALRYFYSEDAPLSIGLIVDLSSSMQNKLDRVRQAVDEFFKLADPADDYFVITFSDKPRLLANTTQSTETIQAKLAEMRAKGNTALADAIHMGIGKLKSAAYRRRALLIISDGGDNASRHSLRSVKNLAKESDLQIYAVDVCDGPALLFTKKLEERFGKQWLTQVTEQTGGRTIAVDDASKMPKAASQISRELRNQYVLAYRPAADKHDGRWRKLKVKVTRAPDPLPYQVYYRTGYMARKDKEED